MSTVKKLRKKAISKGCSAWLSAMRRISAAMSENPVAEPTRQSAPSARAREASRRGGAAARSSAGLIAARWSLGGRDIPAILAQRRGRRAEVPARTPAVRENERGAASGGEGARAAGAEEAVVQLALGAVG